MWLHNYTTLSAFIKVYPFFMLVHSRIHQHKVFILKYILLLWSLQYIVPISDRSRIRLYNTNTNTWKNTIDIFTITLLFSFKKRSFITRSAICSFRKALYSFSPFNYVMAGGSCSAACKNVFFFFLFLFVG